MISAISDSETEINTLFYAIKSSENLPKIIKVSHPKSMISIEQMLKLFQ